MLLHLAHEKQATVVLTAPVPELVEEVADRIVILREGQILAADTLAGLRERTGCAGSLGEVLEKLMHPATLGRLEHYFEERLP